MSSPGRPKGSYRSAQHEGIPVNTSPLPLHAAPAAGFDQPFEMLEACHERVQRSLRLLLRLARHLADQGPDADAAQAARDVMRYFDIAGPAHHEDEERHLFPALLAQGGADNVALVQGLQQDHVRMSAQWQLVRADLQEVLAGRWSPALGQAAPLRWQAYAALYDRHIVTEENQAYPAARPLFDAGAVQAMGQEMAQRRGAAGPWATPAAGAPPAR